jgi:predicted peptidase
MFKKILLALLVILSVRTGWSQDLGLYEKRWYINGTDTLPYRILLPENYDAKRKYPLVLFLHGAGERGNDNEKQLIHGSKQFLKPDIRKDYPAIVVFPQCPENSFWANLDFKTENGKRTFAFRADGDPTISMKLVQELLQKLMNDYPVNKKRIYVTGLSMGGMGTFEIVRRNPKLFAAAMPICGGGEPSTAPALKKVKWWIFHGAKDDVVPPANSERMVAALKEVKASVKFTLYPEANHNSWDAAFAEPDFLKWMFEQRRK